MALRWSRVVFGLAFVFVVASASEAFAQDAPYSPPSEWRPGQPAPDGFIVKKSKLGKSLVIAGATVLGAGYISAAALGFGGEVLCVSWPRSDGGERAKCAGVFAQTFIPIAGPFLLFGEGGGTTDGFGKMLLVDGVLQSVGAVTVVTGLALDATAPRTLAPDSRSSDHARTRIHVVPVVSGAIAGAMVVGTF